MTVANVLPPTAYVGAPSTLTVAAGTVLFRVHLSQYPPEWFSPVLSHRYYGGGRFDATEDDPYEYMYAGESIDIAVAETLLRDLTMNMAGTGLLPRAKVRGRRISAVELTVDVDLVALCSLRQLRAVAQDPWLTTAEPRDYAQTRHWGHWIRDKQPAAAGYVWMSRRDPAQRSYVFFEDRMPRGTVVATTHPDVPPGDEADFDTPQGLRALRRRLSAYGVAVAGR